MYLCLLFHECSFGLLLLAQILKMVEEYNTRWFKYDRDCLCVNLATSVPVIFEPPSNINSQLDATLMVFINNPNQLNMFRAMISPILRSTRLCLQLKV